MKRSIFDNMIIAFLLISLLCFTALLAFTNIGIRRIMINERTTNLVNQSRLITDQYVRDYFSGRINNAELARTLSSLRDFLDEEIWVTDSRGRFIAVSDQDQNSEKKLPDTLRDISPELSTDRSFDLTGRFYGIFSTDTLSVGTPIVRGSESMGYIIMHMSLDDVTDTILSIRRFLYLAYMIILLLLLLFFYHFIRKIVTPISEINAVAAEYSEGRFDEHIEVKTKYELATLANSMNYMRDEIMKSEEYRKNFISNISHDFRSPLTSIHGYAEAMIDGTIPPEKHEHYLQVILKETDRLTKLTSGMIKLNDISNHSITLKRQTFDINETIRSVTDLFEGRSRQKNIRLRADIPGVPLMVDADPEKINQVLYNLTDNALKFTPEGGDVFITALERGELKDRAYISVKDNGPGIDEESRPHVFERFYKADTSRGRDRMGTGLGLSIVKEIISAHGETITLDTEKGRGCEFTFTLKKAKPGKTR